MKDFKTYLAESKKTYKFKIGVAGELPEHTADHFESALGKFGLVNMSPFKKTPITKRPLDFPQLENVEVHYTFGPRLFHRCTQLSVHFLLGVEGDCVVQ